MSRYWFTGDTHFNHTNILKYCNRPFDSIYHMNETIITRWNERVKDGDTVFHLGDFCFKEKDGIKAQDWLDRLNGNMILLKGNHDCFSKETKLLTINGYKSYKELSVGMIIPTLNIKNNNIEYNPIEDVIINHVDSAYIIKNKTAEACVSSNHELLFAPCKQGAKSSKLFKETAEILWKRKSFINILSSHVSKLNEYSILDDELRLLAWIITDGGIERVIKSPNYVSIKIYQSKGNNIDEIKQLLTRLKIEYTFKTRNRNIKEIVGKKLKSILPTCMFTLHPRKCRFYLKMFGLYNKYVIPSWLYYISDRQMEVFVGELIKGDGHIQNVGTRVLWGNKELLEQIQGLCVTHGLDANVVQQKTRPNNYYLSIHKKKETEFTIRAIKHYHRTIENYNDDMWCVRVKNHNIFTELNGKPMISGNSNSSAKTIIESMVIELGGKTWCLQHHPFCSTYEYNLTGHVHNLWQTMIVKNQIYYNCGVDANDFRPVNIQEIIRNIDVYKRKKL